jgi:MraZ protein
MFRGIHAINIDAKGRITVPGHFREAFMEEGDGQTVLTIDTEERCLLLYPFTQWSEIEEKLQKLPSFHPATRRIQRLLIGHATEIEIDKQGRILLPQLLRDYASLDKVVMLVGQGKKIELWGETQWHASREGWLGENTDGHATVPPELSTLSL